MHSRWVDSVEWKPSNTGDGLQNLTHKRKNKNTYQAKLVTKIKKQRDCGEFKFKKEQITNKTKLINSLLNRNLDFTVFIKKKKITNTQTYFFTVNKSSTHLTV